MTGECSVVGDQLFVGFDGDTWPRYQRSTPVVGGAGRGAPPLGSEFLRIILN
jgi:hypothetical protein